MVGTDMCSIVMPTDYEMVVAHSPPIFSHSPPVGHGFLQRYDSFPAPASRMTRLLKPSSTTTTKCLKSTMVLGYPKRPILVIRSPDESNSSGEEGEPETAHNQKKNKKVVFADDRGMSLTHVRIMTEPSNVPPVWSFRFLSEVMQGIDPYPGSEEDDSNVEREKWEMTFSQPASDYVKFRQRLDKSKVSLENVILKESEQLVMGTVKVCNLAFEKQVFLRISLDSWKTFRDVQCSYLPSPATASSAYVLYDTFSFKFPLPDLEEFVVDGREPLVEFCVRFVCVDQEYWDNNNGSNYTFLKRPQVDLNNNNNNAVPAKNKDIYCTRMDSWGEFASWSHQDNTSPYW